MTLYVLENNNKVINGPRLWDASSFRRSLVDELNKDFELPQYRVNNDIIEIDNYTHIYPAEMHYISCDPLFECVHGPLWDFSSNIASGNFELVSLDIDTIKNKLKSFVATLRYTKENAGTSIVLHDIHTVSIDTSRESRGLYFQQYITLQDTDLLSWKFPECWLIVSKNNILSIISKINQYVQAQYDWEYDQITEINNCTSIESLKALKLRLHNGE